MKAKKILSALLSFACGLSLLTGCGGTTPNTDSNATNANSDHPVITMNAPYRNMAMFYDLVHEKYPEVNLDITPYNGANTTQFFLDMRLSGNLPDIYFSTIYSPGRYEDSEEFLDLSGYDFSGRFAQSRLREVTYDGGVYMLPLGYNALGITYNKTLLEKHGWTLPKTFADLEDLKAKCEEAGVIFCRDQLQSPGYGFQYLCNICDTGFLSTINGMKWQNAFVKGEATVAGTPEMVENLKLLDRWRDLGMLNADGTPESDGATKESMVEGNTLFLIGNSNDLNNAKGANPEDVYRLMPYLSENGKQNVYILNVSRYVGLNKKLAEAGNEKKMDDVLKVIDVLFTQEGIESLDPTQNNSRLLPLKDASINEDSYYADIVDELNTGHTANFIYSGWENIIVPVGEKMIDYVKGNATLDDVIACFDDNQHLLLDNDLETYTTVTETIGLDDCARAVGICFAQATGSEAALISTNPWIYVPDEVEVNGSGVSGCLYPVDITDQQLVEILPTGWQDTIKTVTLTGARIKELAQTGYNKGEHGVFYPYVLVTKGGMELDDNTTYTIPICGATKEVQEEGNIQDSGVVGLEAAKAYFSQFDTMTAKDIIWE